MVKTFIIRTRSGYYHVVARDISQARLTAQELFPEDDILRIDPLMEWS